LHLEGQGVDFKSSAQRICLFYLYFYFTFYPVLFLAVSSPIPIKCGCLPTFNLFNLFTRCLHRFLVIYRIGFSHPRSSRLLFFAFIRL
jgi:hypothetical protein